MMAQRREETSTTDDANVEPVSPYGSKGNTAEEAHTGDTPLSIRKRALDPEAQNQSTTAAPPVKVIEPSDSIWRKRQWWQKSDYQSRRDVWNLKAWQVEQLWQASNFASEIGSPLNAWLTARPEVIEPTVYLAWFQGGMEAMGRWLRRQKGRPAAHCYVHENPPGKSLHFHALVHVPRPLLTDFRAKFSLWFADADVRVDAPTALNRSEKLTYMIKGAPQPVCWKHYGKRPKRGQGYIPFKRIGWSQALGEKARDKYWSNSPVVDRWNQ